VEEIIGQGQQAPSGHIPFTPRAKKVLELSLREALQLGHNYIGAEHILLGLIREGDGVAAQVLVKLGADLNRVRQQVIQLLHGRAGAAQEREPVTGAAEAGPLGRRERRQLAELIGRVESIDARLSSVERRAGTGPDTSDLDQELRRVRQDKTVALGREDYEDAAVLRDRERQLLAEKAEREEGWAAAHPDLASLAERVAQLGEETGRLRGLLRQHGIEPEDGTGAALPRPRHRLPLRAAGYLLGWSAMWAPGLPNSSARSGVRRECQSPSAARTSMIAPAM